MISSNWNYGVVEEVGHLLAGSQGMSDLCGSIIRIGISLGKADAGWLAVLDRSDNRLSRAASYRLADESDSELSGDIDEWLSASKAGASDPAIATPSSGIPAFTGIWERETVSTGLIIPFYHADRNIGVLVLFWKQPNRPIEHFAESLLLLANQAQNAIQNMIQFNESQERSKALESLLKVTRAVGGQTNAGRMMSIVVREAARIFHADGGVLHLANQATGVMEVGASTGIRKSALENMKYRIGEGMIGSVARSGVTLTVKELQPESRWMAKSLGNISSLIIVPMRVQQQTTGVLTVFFRRRRDFSKDDESFLATLANEAAIAIENARLYEQLNARLAEERMLHRFSRHLSSAVGVPAVLKEIVDHVTSFAGASFGSVWMLDGNGDLLQSGAVYGANPAFRDFINMHTNLSLLPGTIGSRTPQALAIRKAQTVVIPDLSTTRRFREWNAVVASTGARAQICMPLIPHDSAIGVISLYFSDVKPLTQTERQALQFLARTSASALHRMMLAERLIEEEISLRASQEANQLKTEFVSLVSHELRTPLTSIQGYVQLMLANHTGDLNDYQREFLGTVLKNTERLTRIVNDLIDISRIESGRMELRLEPTDLSAIITHEATSAREMILARKMELHTDVEEGLPFVKADPHRIGQVISNLLSNAIKYSPEGSSITIRASRSEGEVTINVSDSGIGIASDEHDKVFDRFYRGRSDVVKTTLGAGLGLAIARFLVESQGGKIWVESERGKGSTFSFSLPLFHEDSE
jgi:signal transduction histidine kinase